METIYWSWIPEIHPKIGIKNWNPPKDRAMINACLTPNFRVNPLVTETLNASMASPIAKKIIERISILNPKFFLYGREYKVDKNLI